MYCVYVLKSLRDKRHYIGYTKDIHFRLAQHNTGQVRSTKGRIPFEVIYAKEYKTSLEARKRELELKRMKNGIQFKVLLDTRE